MQYWAAGGCGVTFCLSHYTSQHDLCWNLWGNCPSLSSRRKLLGKETKNQFTVDKFNLHIYSLVQWKCWFVMWVILRKAFMISYCNQSAGECSSPQDTVWICVPLQVQLWHPRLLKFAHVFPWAWCYFK